MPISGSETGAISVSPREKLGARRIRSMIAVWHLPAAGRKHLSPAVITASRARSSLHDRRKVRTLRRWSAATTSPRTGAA